MISVARVGFPSISKRKHFDMFPNFGVVARKLAYFESYLSKQAQRTKTSYPLVFAKMTYPLSGLKGH